MIRPYQFHVNIADAERNDESTDDITAAATAPRPNTPIQYGVR